MRRHRILRDVAIVAVIVVVLLNLQTITSLFPQSTGQPAAPPQATTGAVVVVPSPQTSRTASSSPRPTLRTTENPTPQAKVTSAPPATPPPSAAPANPGVTKAPEVAPAAAAPTPPPLRAFQAPVAAAVPTIFTTFAGQTIVISQAAALGSTVQFQVSTDLVTWVSLSTVSVNSSGQATYSFRPMRTAYYRAYDYGTGGLTSPALGVVVPLGQWTGYAVLKGPFSGVTGTFTVPNLVVPTAETTVTDEWVGIDGIYPNSSLIQAGVSETTSPGSNQVTFQAWWEILPDDPTIVPISWQQLSVLSGHTVTVTIWQTAASSWEIALTDQTTGQIYETPPETYRGPGTSAEWIVEAPADPATGSVYTLGQFTPSVTFSGARFYGVPVAVAHATPEQLQPIVQAGVTVAGSSALTPNGFSVSYGGMSPAG